MSSSYNPPCLKILTHLFSRFKFLTDFIDNNFEKASDFELLIYDLYLQIKNQKNIVFIDGLAQFFYSNPGDFFHYFQMFFQNIDSFESFPCLYLTIHEQRIPYISVNIPANLPATTKITQFISNINQIYLPTSQSFFIQITRDSNQNVRIPSDYKIYVQNTIINLFYIVISLDPSNTNLVSFIKDLNGWNRISSDECVESDQDLIQTLFDDNETPIIFLGYIKDLSSIDSFIYLPQLSQTFGPSSLYKSTIPDLKFSNHPITSNTVNFSNYSSNHNNHQFNNKSKQYGPIIQPKIGTSPISFSHQVKKEVISPRSPINKTSSRSSIHMPSNPPNNVFSRQTFKASQISKTKTQTNDLSIVTPQNSRPNSSYRANNNFSMNLYDYIIKNNTMEKIETYGFDDFSHSGVKKIESMKNMKPSLRTKVAYGKTKSINSFYSENRLKREKITEDIDIYFIPRFCNDNYLNIILSSQPKLIKLIWDKNAIFQFELLFHSNQTVNDIYFYLKKILENHIKLKKVDSILFIKNNTNEPISLNTSALLLSLPDTIYFSLESDSISGRLK